MQILFVMLNPGYVRNFESTLRMLADRGHRIHVGFVQPRKDEDGLADRLAIEAPGLTFGPAPIRDDEWRGLARTVRASMDYLRYRDPRFRDADALRARARNWPLAGWLRILDLPGLGSPPALAAASALLRTIDRAVPVSANVLEYVRARAPDLVLVTPLVDLGSAQVDYVRAARALGVPVALPVASWDNLTNKGIMRVDVDRVIVWNDLQKREAIELHAVPAERIVVAGAPRFDEWFGRKPSVSRADLCALAGLRPDAPYVLYVCSSPFIAPSEVTFVRGWLRRLRAFDQSPLRDVGVLVRPHPQNAHQWRTADLSDLGSVSVWPREGANPVTARAKDEFFDSIYHSAAVVGINTTAMIEAGIVGRPVFSVLADAFRGGQTGTLHFGYLDAANGGHVRIAATFEKHLEQLAEAVSGPPKRGQERGFVERFVRPNGADIPSTPGVVSAIEGVGDRLPARPVEVEPFAAPLIRALLWPLARLGDAAWSTRHEPFTESRTSEREESWLSVSSR